MSNTKNELPDHCPATAKALSLLHFLQDEAIIHEDVIAKLDERLKKGGEWSTKDRKDYHIARYKRGELREQQAQILRLSFNCVG